MFSSIISKYKTKLLIAVGLLVAIVVIKILISRSLASPVQLGDGGETNE